MAIVLKSKQQHMLVRMWSKEKPYPLLVGVSHSSVAVSIHVGSSEDMLRLYETQYSCNPIPMLDCWVPCLLFVGQCLLNLLWPWTFNIPPVSLKCWGSGCAHQSWPFFNFLRAPLQPLLFRERHPPFTDDLWFWSKKYKQEGIFHKSNPGFYFQDYRVLLDMNAMCL